MTVPYPVEQLGHDEFIQHCASLCLDSDTCDDGTEIASLETTGLLSVNENLEAWDPHYAVRAMVDGDLLVLNWSPTESVARGVNRNGEAVEVHSWQQMVFEPSCNFKWMSYRAGDPIPEGAVVGGRLADGTPLYVVMTLSLSVKRPIGYYNPASNTFSSYWVIVMNYSGIANILVKT